MLTQDVNVNLSAGGVAPVVYVSQYDTGSRVLRIHLSDTNGIFSLPDSAAGYIQGTKPDGTCFLYSCEREEDVVIANVTAQMTALYGRIRCEVVLQDGEERLATGDLILQVKPSAVPDDAVDSKTEIPLVGTLEEAAETAVMAEKKAAESLKNAQASESRAGGYADSASGSAEKAKASAEAAKQSEEKSMASEKSASESAIKAASSQSDAQKASSSSVSAKNDASAFARASQSYAVGGTKSRDGEDTDNARYYASQAKNAAEKAVGNDVLSISGLFLTMEDSADARVQKLSVYGKSTQQTYEGYNLCGGEFKNQRYWAQKNADLLTLLNNLPVGTYRFWTYGMVTAVDENYDAEKSGRLVCGAAIYIGDSEFISTQVGFPENTVGSSVERGKTMTITEDVKGTFTSFYLYTCGAGKDGIHGSGDLKVMITAGEEEKEYEPYVGGMASPNIRYPQAVETVKKVSLFVYGRNLLQEKEQDGTINGVAVKSDGQGGVFMKGTASAGFGFYYDYPAIPGGNYRLRILSDGTVEDGIVEITIYRAGAEEWERVVFPDAPEKTITYDADNPAVSIYLWVDKGTKLNTTITADLVPDAFSEGDFVPSAAVSYTEPLTGKDGKSYELCSVPVNRKTVLRDELRILPDGSRKLIKHVAHEQFTKDSGWRTIINKPESGIYLYGAHIQHDVQFLGTAICSHAVCQVSTSAGYGKFYVEENNFYLFSDKDTLDAFLETIGSQTLDLFYNLLDPEEINLSNVPAVRTNHGDTTMWTSPLLDMDLFYANETAEGAMQRTDGLSEKFQKMETTENLLSGLSPVNENISIHDSSRFYRRWNGESYDYYLYLRIGIKTIEAGTKSLVNIPEDYCPDAMYGTGVIGNTVIPVMIGAEGNMFSAVLPEAVEEGYLTGSFQWMK